MDPDRISTRAIALHRMSRELSIIADDDAMWPRRTGMAIICDHHCDPLDAETDGVDLQDAIAVLRWLGY